MSLLEVTNIQVSFGAVRAVDGVDLRVEAGSLVGLIGPNGAGKTTLIDAITGFVPASGGVRFDGHSLDGASACDRARSGLVRTWQSVELFDDLTVRENLEVACAPPSRSTGLRGLVSRARTHTPPEVDELVDRFDIGHLVERTPDELSAGQRKLVGLARAMVRDPKLLLLDEPASGLDTTESQDLGRRLRRAVESGVAMLLVDHDMGLVLGISDHVYVLEHGGLIAQGPPDVIRSDENVLAAYLGQRHEHGALHEDAP